MIKFHFLDNAYWCIDTINNICYIRTVEFETAMNIFRKYEVTTSDPGWNKDITLINDYEDLIGVSLRFDDIKKISDFHSSILDRLGYGNWYFITSKLLHFGIIRMYASYVNYFDGPAIIVHKEANDIEDERIKNLLLAYRTESRLCEEREQRLLN